jgi:hypothetical protein
MNERYGDAGQGGRGGGGSRGFQYIAARQAVFLSRIHGGILSVWMGAKKRREIIYRYTESRPVSISNPPKSAERPRRRKEAALDTPSAA